MGYCIGNPRLFELSEANRGSIVYNAKCMGLFSNEGTSLNSSMHVDSVKGEWRAWIQQERRCRLGWVIFVRASCPHLLCPDTDH